VRARFCRSYPQAALDLAGVHFAGSTSNSLKLAEIFGVD
jgi:hypothetical protein